MVWSILKLDNSTGDIMREYAIDRLVLCMTQIVCTLWIYDSRKLCTALTAGSRILFQVAAVEVILCSMLLKILLREIIAYLRRLQEALLPTGHFVLIIGKMIGRPMKPC